MHKPQPKKDAECDGCCELKPLLMPVGGAPGWPVIIWEMLCLQCRLNSPQRPSEYWKPGEWMQFNSDPEIRAQYDEWLEYHPSYM